MTLVCLVEGCGKKRDGRSRICGMHRKRMAAHGDLHTTLKAANGSGYLQNGYPGHQVAGIRKFDHITIAERALGRSLPPEAVVHHANEDRQDNRNENLVICPNRAYHNLLHARMEARKASGNPDWRRCRHCKQYEPLKNLRVYPHGTTTSYWHPACARANTKQRSLQKCA